MLATLMGQTKSVLITVFMVVSNLLTIPLLFGAVISFVGAAFYTVGSAFYIVPKFFGGQRMNYDEMLTTMPPRLRRLGTISLIGFVTCFGLLFMFAVIKGLAF
jgi:hypothetical protein